MVGFDEFPFGALPISRGYVRFLEGNFYFQEFSGWSKKKMGRKFDEICQLSNQDIHPYNALPCQKPCLVMVLAPKDSSVRFPRKS